MAENTAEIWREDYKSYEFIAECWMTDDKDLQILEELTADGRKSVVEMAKDLGLPLATVQERLRKMVASGLIRKFVAIPDYTKTGRGTTAYVLVSFSAADRVTQRSLAETIAKIPQVYEVSLIAGEWDILLKVRAGSVEEIGRLVIDQLRMTKGLGKTQTCVCFQTIKETF